MKKNKNLISHSSTYFKAFNRIPAITFMGYESLLNREAWKLNQKCRTINKEGMSVRINAVFLNKSVHDD